MTSHRELLPALLSLLICLAACATQRDIEPLTVALPDAASRAPAEVRGADMEGLYSRLEEAARAYEFGVELIGLGEETAGESRLVLAANELGRVAQECDLSAGCEMGRVISTFDRLLDRQNLVLKQQAFRIDLLETSIEEEEVDREPGTTPFAISVSGNGEAVSLLQGTDLRDIITLNGPVKAALDDWLTWMRPSLMAAYENYQYLRADIAPIYEEAELPEALLFAMMATESGVKVHAYSRAGAAGPLQFMSRTGKRYGLEVVDGFDLRLDPVAATRANVAYLEEQLEVLDNSLEKAMAAYNGGENRMRSLHRRLGGTSLWDSRVYYSLPRETREYVPRVLAAAWLFLHPEDYNLEFPTVQAETGPLALREAIALGELTICLGQAFSQTGWFRTLRNLNPKLDPGERIKAGDEIVVPSVLVPIYEERCLAGEPLARARELHDANYPEQPEMIIYTVRRGDTLNKIASRHRCAGVREIASINGIRPPRYVIRVGQRLKVPACK